MIQDSDTANRIEQVWRVIREAYEWRGVKNPAPFERFVVQAMMPPLSDALGVNPSYSGPVETMDLLQKLLPLPFAVFPVAITYPYGALPTDSVPVDHLCGIASRAQMYLRHLRFVVVVQCGRQLMAIHNQPELNVSGEKFPLCNLNQTVLWMDPLPLFLEAFRRACRQVDGYALSTAPGYVRHNQRWAVMSGRVLDVIRRITKVGWRLYFTLCLNADYRERTICMSQRDLAERGNLFQSTIPGGIRQLVALGLVKTELCQAGWPGTYSLPVEQSGSDRLFITVPELPLHVPSELRKRDWAVYVAMVAHMSYRTGLLLMNHKDIALRSGIHVSHVSRAIWRLERSGLIVTEIHKSCTSRKYWILGRKEVK